MPARFRRLARIVSLAPNFCFTWNIRFVIVAMFDCTTNRFA